MKDVTKNEINSDQICEDFNSKLANATLRKIP